MLKICLIGESKHEKELNFIKDQLKDHIVYIPILEFSKDNKTGSEFFEFLRENILDSEYIIMIEDVKNNLFTFNFGMIYGSGKKYKVIKIENIKKLMDDKKRG
jgi:hypothetical protein